MKHIKVLLNCSNKSPYVIFLSEFTCHMVCTPFSISIILLGCDTNNLSWLLTFWLYRTFGADKFQRRFTWLASIRHYLSKCLYVSQPWKCFKCTVLKKYTRICYYYSVFTCTWIRYGLWCRNFKNDTIIWFK